MGDPVPAEADPLANAARKKIPLNLDAVENVDMMSQTTKKKGGILSFLSSSKKHKAKHKSGITKRSSKSNQKLDPDDKNNWSRDSMESVIRRRQLSAEMTRSLDMDRDIYQYLRNRPASYDQNEKEDKEASQVFNVVNPLPAKKKQPPVLPARVLPNNDDIGLVRQVTQTPQLELERRRKKGFLGFFRALFTSSGSKKSFFARFRDRFKSKKRRAREKKESEMKALEMINNNEMNESSKEEDVLADSSLLVDDGDATEQEKKNSGERTSLKQLFEEARREREEEQAELEKQQVEAVKNKAKESKRPSILNTAMTRASVELPKVSREASDRKSDDFLQAEKDKIKVERVFCLDKQKDRETLKKINVVNTGKKQVEDEISPEDEQV